MKALLKGRRILAMVLACLMLTALVACGGTKGQESSNNQTATTTKAAAEATTAAKDPLQEPVTLSVMIGGGNVTDGVMDVPIFNEIKKATGITIDVVTTSKDKIKLQVAGGDLADIIILPESAELAPTLISSGSIIPLDGLLETHGKNIVNNIPTALRWEKEIIGNGKIYFIPVGTARADLNNPKPNGSYGIFARWDVYKEIGAPAMSNENDFLAVLKQMQDHKPTTNDGKKVYALSAWTDWGIWPYMIMYPFSYGYGNKGDYASVSRETGEMESNLLKEDGVFWRGIAFYNRAYRMGIFDPEGFTMKWDQYTKKIQNGEVLTGPNPGDTVNPKLTNELAALVCLPGAFPYVNGVFPGDSLIGYGNNGARAISASCKYPERAMQLMNYLDSGEGARLIINGIKGVDWDTIDGKPQLIGEHLTAVQTGQTAEYYKKTLIGALSLHTTGSVHPEDNYPVDLKNTPDVAAKSASAGLKDFAKFFDSSFEYAGQAYAKLYKEGKIKTTLGTPHLGMGLMGTPSDTTNQTLSKGTQYFAANVAKLIIAKDDAAFEAEKKKAIEDIKAMGYEKAFAEILELFEKGKETADKFAK